MKSSGYVPARSAAGQLPSLSSETCTVVARLAKQQETTLNMHARNSSISLTLDYERGWGLRGPASTIEKKLKEAGRNQRLVNGSGSFRWNRRRLPSRLRCQRKACDPSRQGDGFQINIWDEPGEVDIRITVALEVKDEQKYLFESEAGHYDSHHVAIIEIDTAARNSFVACQRVISRARPWSSRLTT